jgi:Xaa-Pro aminopeptidase
VLNKDQIEGLRAAAKIAAATLKHALENTKVPTISLLMLTDWNEA